MSWLRYDLDAGPAHPRLYTILAETAGLLVHGRAAAEVFFVHTPLGVRLRCRANQPLTADVAWRAALAEARERGWLAAWRPAPFEPESLGLGGPRAMTVAHRVFTADSLAWLRFHAEADRPVPTITRWAMSLLMVRALVEGLALTAWETADLWDRVARSAARLHGPDRLTLTRPDDPATRRLAVVIRAGWDGPVVLRDRLSPRERDLVAAYEATVRPAAADWREAAATAPSPASLRHGAALAVLFHWNRAALPAHHQHLLTTALRAAAAVPRPLVAA